MRNWEDIHTRIRVYEEMANNKNYTLRERNVYAMLANELKWVCDWN